MSRLLARLHCFVVVASVASCGGGGRSASAGGGTVIDLTTQPFTATSGQLLVVSAATEPFNAGTDYTVSWLRDGAVAATERARAVDPRSLAMLAPVLDSADFQVDVALPGVTGRLRGRLTRAAPVADPAGYVANVRAEFGSAVALLRDRANGDADPVRRAARLADLDRVEQRLATFDAARQAAAAVDVQHLADLFDASPLLRRSGPGGARGPGSIDEAQRLATIAEELLGARDLGFAGAGAVALGLDAANPLTAAGLVASGLLALATALPDTDAAVARAFQPVDELLVQFVGAGNGRLGGSGLPADTTLRLTSGAAMPIAGSASFGTLSQADRGHSDAAVRAAIAELDELHALFDGLDPQVLALVASRPAALPAESGRERAELEVARVTLVAHGNPQIVLALVAGVLTARLDGATPPVSTAAQFRYDATGNLGALTTTVTVEIVPVLETMVAIPAGTFTMGSNAANVAPYFGQPRERPVHPVTITRPFWMGRFEVTQADWQAVMGNNPSQFLGPQRPVETVSWAEAMAFCAALTTRERAAGRVPTGYQYRLPTEAEWEYCCRAGTTTEFSFDGLLCGQANFHFSYHSNSYCGASGTVNVGGYPANGFGLHDMHGNVFEWCLDAWDGSANYPAAGVIDPWVAVGPGRVLRGGSWFNDSDFCRSANRFLGTPSDRGNYLGFRVALAPVLVP